MADDETMPPDWPGWAEAALADVLRHTPEVGRDALRRTVRLVLACHFAELANGRDQWPGERIGDNASYFPSDALRDLAIGESAVLDHVDQVAERLLARVGSAERTH